MQSIRLGEATDLKRVMLRRASADPDEEIRVVFGNRGKSLVKDKGVFKRPSRQRAGRAGEPRKNHVSRRPRDEFDQAT